MGIGARIAIASLAVGGMVPVPARAQELAVEGLGYVLGDSAAPVEVVEFGDFACSACAEFWRDSWRTVRTELIETGRVVWRHVPILVGFRRGEEAANAAQCAADQGAFWRMHDLLFERQRAWTSARDPDDMLAAYAGELGLDAEDFAECYDDDRGRDRTREGTRASRRARIRGTPTFFVDGRPVPGAVPYPLLLEVIEVAEREARGRRQ